MSPNPWPRLLSRPTFPSPFSGEFLHADRQTAPPPGRARVRGIGNRFTKCSSEQRPQSQRRAACRLPPACLGLPVGFHISASPPSLFRTLRASEPEGRSWLGRWIVEVNRCPWNTIEEEASVPQRALPAKLPLKLEVIDLVSFNVKRSLARQGGGVTRFCEAQHVDREARR